MFDQTSHSVDYGRYLLLASRRNGESDILQVPLLYCSLPHPSRELLVLPEFVSITRAFVPCERFPEALVVSIPINDIQ